jgi:RHS repeat-associated protein
VFSWIHTDRLGTPLAVTSTPGSGSAQVIWRATYEPFGLATPDEDPDGDMQSFVLDLRLPGQVFDVESGQYYNYYRIYDATTGRYLEADPIGQLGGVNVFAYSINNPTRFVDPDGRDFQEFIETFTAAGPIDSYRAQGSIANQAETMAQNSGLPGPLNGPQDAFRHCVWICEVTRASDRASARQIGGAHERANRRAGRPYAESQMDLANNDAGIGCALNGPPDCAEGCMNKLHSGELFGVSGRPMPPPATMTPAPPNPGRVYE